MPAIPPETAEPPKPAETSAAAVPKLPPGPRVLDDRHGMQVDHPRARPAQPLDALNVRGADPPPVRQARLDIFDRHAIHAELHVVGRAPAEEAARRHDRRRPAEALAEERMEAGQELEQLRQVLRRHALDVLAGQDGDGCRRLRERFGPALGRDDHLFMDLPGPRRWTLDGVGRRGTGRRLLSRQGRRREDRQQGGERDALQAVTSARARRAPAAAFSECLAGRQVNRSGPPGHRKR